MYTVLVAPSGKCRKGTAMNMGLQLLRKTATHIAAESITRASFIRSLTEAQGTFFNPTSVETEIHCSITVFSMEFGVFLGVGQLQFMQDLCDIYDCRDQWTYKTKHEGVDALEGVCLNLVAATTPEYLQLELARESVGIGLASRIIFVVEEEKGKVVVFPFLTEKERNLRLALTTDLERISLLCGEFKIDQDVLNLYEEWYTRTEGRTKIDDSRFSGYSERQATHMKKLWILSAASRSDEMRITSYDFFRAKVVLEETEKKMPLAFGALGINRLAPVMDRVYRWIGRHQPVKHATLSREFWRDVTPGEMKVVIEALREQQVIQIQYDQTTKEPRYSIRD